MNIRFETSEEKKLAGKRKRMSFNNHNPHELWKSFMPRRKEIKNTKGTSLFSLEVYDSPLFFRNFNTDTEFDKWAAVEVENFDDIPDDMEMMTLPAGLYAVFIHRGPAYEAKITYDYIFKTWLPDSGFELDFRPHCAVMGDKYKNDDPESEEEIWIPVKQAAKTGF